MSPKSHQRVLAGPRSSAVKIFGARQAAAMNLPGTCGALRRHLWSDRGRGIDGSSVVARVRPAGPAAPGFAQAAVMPPSITSSDPVTQVDSSEAR